MRNAIIYLTMLIQLSSFFIGCGKDNGTDDPNNPNGNGGEQTTLTISPNELTFKSEGLLQTQVHGVKLIRPKVMETLQ